MSVPQAELERYQQLSPALDFKPLIVTAEQFILISIFFPSN